MIGVNTPAGSSPDALACAAFEMLTGHRPFERDQDVALMWGARPEPGVPPWNDLRFLRRPTEYPHHGYCALMVLAGY